MSLCLAKHCGIANDESAALQGLEKCGSRRVANRCKLWECVAEGVVTIPNDQRLDGWKAIANFLGRERTTAIRWANERGLPVHRVPGGRTGTVYAIRSELEAWLAGDRVDAETTIGPNGDASDITSKKGAFGKQGLVAILVATLALAVLFLVSGGRTSPATDAPVTVAAIASPDASREAQEFVRSLNADLARFANATPTLAVYDREPGKMTGTQYAIRTDVERVDGNMVANARLVAVSNGEVLWSRRFVQAGPSLSALRGQIAANMIGVLRCSFGGLEDERSKAKPADLAQLMAICQNFEEDDMPAAEARARQLTVAHPELGLAWAMLGTIQGQMSSEGDTALRAQALANALRARAIAPDSVCTFLALAAANSDGRTNTKTLAILDAALRKHPDNPWLQNSRSVILFNLGYVEASVAPALASVRNDPSSFGGRDIAVRRLAAAGQTKDALQLQAENEHLWPGHPQAIANRARINVDPVSQAKADAQAILDNEREVTKTPMSAYMLARLYERTGDRAAALRWLARAPVNQTQQQWSLLFWPDAAGLRTEPAFFRKMADLGLVRWWIARKEWPDFCSEPNLKYSCADEARKTRLAAKH
jgi:tetratricopeptide (TPR) repeat protein